MNYRHVYHAGNFADVIKHLTLVLILDYLKKKDKPFFVLDAHGGCGLYDLQSEQAQKTGEWEQGIGLLMPLPRSSPIREGRDEGPAKREGEGDIKLYLDLVQKDLAKNKYPGSPLIINRILRKKDRLVANELHSDDYKTLRMVMGSRDNVQITNMDAYECIRALLPPPERRGLVLIDPPFEEKNEFAILAKQMKEWKKRWETGIYLLWYPIKSHLPTGSLHEAAKNLGLKNTWLLEVLLHPRGREKTLNGCGLILFNAPYQMPERLEKILPIMKDKLCLLETKLECLAEE